MQEQAEEKPADSEEAGKTEETAAADKPAEQTEVKPTEGEAEPPKPETTEVCLNSSIYISCC